MARTFLNKYPGKLCSRCGKEIALNVPVGWDRRAAHGSRNWHIVCPVSESSEQTKASDAGKAELPRTPCPKCGQLYYDLPSHMVRMHSEQEEPKAEETKEQTATEEPKQEERQEAMSEQTEQTGDNALVGLAKAISPFLNIPKAEINEASVKAIVEKALQGFTAPVIVEIRQESKEPKQIKGVHKVYPRVLRYARRRTSLYLRGPAGSGKTTIAKQIAEALELPFGMISLNVQTAEYKLFGTVSAHGEYRGTDFRTLFENGGIFLIDEMDNAAGNLLTSLNTALANGLASFPDGNVKAHPDFFVIATGNTAGRGASRLHSDRRQLDAATLDRFASIEIGYDWTLVRAAAKAINPKADAWVDWTKAASDHCAKAFPNVLIGPRAALLGAKHAADESRVEDLADAVAFKGLDETVSKAILQACPLPNLNDIREAN